MCPADPRTLDQRRADALLALSQGSQLACKCGESECPNKVDGTDLDRGGAQVIINVVASDQTVSGNSAAPGYLEGYGIIDAEQVRELAAAAASLRLCDPVTSAREALRYQPSAALERATSQNV